MTAPNFDRCPACSTFHALGPYCPTPSAATTGEEHQKTLGEEVEQALAPYANGWVARMPFPMALAPRDGRLLRLLVDYSDGDHALEDELEAWTFGHNNYDNDGEDRWRFAGWSWSQDHFTEGRGEPIGWLPEYEGLVSYVSLPRSGRDDLIEQCAVAAEAQDRVGREWVSDSLWDNIMKRAGANVRALKGLTQR